MTEQLTLPFEPVYTIGQAADATGLKYWLLLRAVKNGDIPVYRFGNQRARIRLSDIAAVMAASQSGGAR